MRFSFLMTIVVILIPSISQGQQVIVQWEPPAPTLTGTISQAPVVNVAGGVPYLTFSMDQSNFSFWGADEMSALNQASVRKDLELLDEQFQEITQIRERFNKQMSDARQVAKKNPDRAKDLSITIKRMRDKQKAAITEVLLPHQQERLKQVRQQLQMKAAGTANALTRGTLAKELEITDEQKKELADLKKKLQEEILAKTNELKEEAKKEMFSKLTPEQRLKLKKLLGDDFKRNPDDK